ncbi:MAG TPA: two-component regulator propeller domain-containing protein [Bacteroidales bacterium]|nr:two-component regulator propeller domain-containing protein [Bacteroidales bacterium]
MLTTFRNNLNFCYFLLILISFFSVVIVSAQPNYRFEHLSKNEGLSQGTINAIFEDMDGLMWFGTKDGLNRYDGHEIKVFRRNFNDSLSLPNNHILSINQDKTGRLWIGTFGNNLSYFDPITEMFYNWKNFVSEEDDINIGDKIFCIEINHQNNKLLAGSDKGILIVDLKSKEMRFLDMQNFMVDSIHVGNIYSLLSEGEDFWIGTDYGGLIHFNTKTNTFTPIGYDHMRSNLTATTNKGTILYILKDNSSNIWVATFGDYVLRLDREKNLLSKIDFEQHGPVFHELAFTRQIALVGDTAIWATNEYGFQVFDLQRQIVYNTRYSPDNPFGVSSSGLKTVFADSNGGVWIGGNGYGLNYYFPVSKGFKHLMYQPGQPKGLDFRSIRTIFVDKNQNLFVGGYGGMNAFDKAGNAIWKNPALNVAYITLPDTKNKNLLWVGRENGGLNLVNKKNGEIVQYLSNVQPNEKNRLLGNFVMSLLFKSEDELWIGTESGLNLLNTKTNTTVHFRHDPNNKTSIPEGRISCIFRDSKGRTWLASIGGGVAYMKDDDMTFRSFKNNQRDPLSISSNNVFYVAESRSGEIYIGTESGLNRFDKTTQTFTTYTTSDGLVNDVVYRIESDAKGRLWISTNEGLSCFDPENKSFRNYTREDGLQANEFNNGASFVDQYGTMYFGGVNGVSIFDPLSLQDNTTPPEVIFTNLTVGNNRLIIDPPITQAKQVNLEYDNQSFRLEFAALNFYKAKKNQYAYRIRELQNEWQMLGNTNSIEIVRLGHGTFTIEVIASNNDNHWNFNPAQLTIYIAPPFRLTTWFKISTLIALILFLILLYRLRLSNLEHKKLALEKQVSTRTRELLEANSNLKSEIEIRLQTEEELKIANNTKDRFFSIIAHDLKNPLAALLGLTEIMRNEFDLLSEKEKKDIATMMFNSANDNYKLLETLFSWARSQQKQLKLDIHEQDLYEIVSENIGFLTEQAKSKKIQLLTDIPENTCVFVDYQTISTVVRNLISNAIKFTHIGGLVQISSQKAGNHIILNVTDNGIGMQPEDLDKLFRIDAQFKQDGTLNEKGTGLGLVLCKEFMQANKGSISAKSEKDKGSTFSISLPACNA